jgi:pimeloyl-ACP methyl ester carboxylesterase
VFLDHGLPGSRLLCPSGEQTRAAGVRLVVADRPGYGRSDPKPRRAVSDWPADVVALANHLGIDRLALLGWSGGGPHTLACASEIPERLTACVLVCPSGPPEELTELFDIDGSIKLVYDTALRDRTEAEAGVAAFTSGYAENPKRFADEARELGDAMWAQTEFATNFYDHTVEAFAQGIDGFAQDVVATRSPWGFRVSDVAFPVILFHGGPRPADDRPRGHVLRRDAPVREGDSSSRRASHLHLHTLGADPQ